MDIKRELDKKIEKKIMEIFDLDQRIGRERAYLQALEDTRKMLPKDLHSQPELTLRAGSELAKVQEILKKENKPIHIDELLKRLGKPLEKKQKISLSGSLASYARDGKIFTRPAANTFGLLDFENALELISSQEPPKILECFNKQLGISKINGILACRYAFKVSSGQKQSISGAIKAVLG